MLSFHHDFTLSVTHVLQLLDARAVDLHGDGLVPHGGNLLVVIGRGNRALQLLGHHPPVPGLLFSNVVRFHVTFYT